jgi:hypothetical protein
MKADDSYLKLPFLTEIPFFPSFGLEIFFAPNGLPLSGTVLYRECGENPNLKCFTWQTNRSFFNLAYAEIPGYSRLIINLIERKRKK